MAKLLIVESPTKAKTISKFLGKDYEVLSSFGHIRDLPKKKIGVDVTHGFEPTYEVPADKKPRVKALQDAAKKADDIYLATDEDREGEAIAWHIAHVLKVKPSQAKRITFHEITRPAIEAALTHARTIDEALVNAQQTRRILDRLVGYELSPLLWKKIRRGLSAGRVQSVAVRMIVERERERQAFKPQDYWTIEADFIKDKQPFTGKLFAIENKTIDKLDVNSQEMADTIAAAITGQDFVVQTSEQKEVSKKPPTPLTTSTLQQEAYNRLGMSAKQTMTLAQKLYETGRITYMRTDSLNLSDEFLTAAQTYIKQTWGEQYAAGSVRYKTKKKGAQEAHEAIRPTNASASPESLKGADIDNGMRKLYEMIWRRTLASQMPAAKIRRTAVDLDCKNYTFRATGATVVFPGYMKVWKATDDKILPTLVVGDNVGKPFEIRNEKHTTEPPARYSDATLVKAMEEFGVGRPSTYAPTIATVIDRGYVLRDDNNRLQPVDIAFIVIDLLKDHFPDIVDYEFTATMEQKLDEIAEGTHDWQTVLSTFYGPFHFAIEEKTKDLTREAITKKRILGDDPKTGLPIIVQTGRFGPYVQVGEPEGDVKPRRASLAKDALVDTVTLEDALYALELPRIVGKTAEGKEIMANVGRFGPYVACDGVYASLPPTVDPRKVTLEDAEHIFKEAQEKKQRMLTPIAELGKDPKSGKEIVVRDGRYGPYVTNGELNATIPKKIDPKSVSLADALDLLEKKAKAPKRNFPRKRKNAA